MASEIKAVEGPMKNSKLDPAAKAGDVKMSCMKDGSVSDATSCISSGDATSSIKENEVERESVRAKQGMYYPVNGNSGYYYPEYDAQSYYLGTGGLGIQPSASQVDNGSLMYYFPSFQPDYTPYNSFLPGAMPNVDGQYLGQQLYYPSSIFSPPFVSPGLFPQPVAYAPELIPAYSWDSSQLYTDGIYGNIYGDSTYSAPKPNFSSQRHTHIPSKNLPTSKFGSTEAKGSSRTASLSPNLATSNQPHKPLNKVSILSNGFLPVKKLPSYPNQGRSGLSWVGTEKLKARNKVNGSDDLDLMNEQNRGPRIMGVKSNIVANPVGSLETEENASDVVVRKDEYNLLDFATRYDHALFFVIKSYSEDDIHKSIKYNVWASTPNGNKRLDNAFQVAQEKMAEKGSKCPVFLFFSVNASGQFCGVAEMTGRVDFNMSMDFWQQDKWTGYFPVKWHIIKDVPNLQFRNIILENNENKPVTNSRDTQEVKLIQGTEMLNMFKNYNSKTSILDDFGFYEERQKAMRDKRRSKDPTPCLENLQPKIEVMDQDAIVSGLLSLKLAVDDAKKQLPTGDKVKE